MSGGAVVVGLHRRRLCPGERVTDPETGRRRHAILGAGRCPDRAPRRSAVWQSLPSLWTCVMTQSVPDRYLIGVDVGTGSARAGVFCTGGRLLASAKQPITIWHEAGDVVEQSADQIWSAVCAAVRGAVVRAAIDPCQVAGIGFDATCSLVAVKADGAPVTISHSGDPARNVMVWMDHRAAGEAAEINAGRHAVLAYVGGRISPEMQTPKLLWLKRNLQDSFAAADHFFDLADYLTWRASGSASRSTCTVTCKWTYLAHEKRWDAAYFGAIGLGALADEAFTRIGTDMVEPGTPLGSGLTAKAADDMGLARGTAIAAALIDAHAGGIGTLGVPIPGSAEFTRRLAYVFGTSACSMASATAPVFVNGVWGPYFSAMVPGLWLNEGGQSAAGAAMDHLVAMHPASAQAAALAKSAGQSVIGWLDHRALAACTTAGQAVYLARGLHVVPEFLGNRSPLADPDSRAVIAGLGLDSGLDDLTALYVAGLCGIGYGLRQLLDAFAQDGIRIATIVASGGAAQSPLVRQMLADATGVAVAAPLSPEPVLLGAAMLASVAAGHSETLSQAMAEMSGSATVYLPAGGAVQAKHAARYEAFKLLQAVGRQIKDA